MNYPSDYKRWDLFISHASEDKADVARPLAAELRNLRMRVWYDEYELDVGNSLSESISHGLSNSRFGVIVVSPAYIGKKWPMNELSALFALEDAQSRLILPVWHNVGEYEVKKFNSILADRFALNTSFGIRYVAVRLWQKIPRNEPSSLKIDIPIQGSWNGATGRLNLAFTQDDKIVGEYDWYRHLMSGSLIGNIVAPRVVEFEWKSELSSESGNGFFVVIVRPCKFQDAWFLFGAWAYREDKINFLPCAQNILNEKNGNESGILNSFLSNSGIPPDKHKWEFSTIRSDIEVQFMNLTKWDQSNQ